MHSLVRRYLKTGIVFLAVGLAIGLWMMAERDLLGRFPSRYEQSSHTIVGLGVFFYTMWTRIRPVGSQAREARGEKF